MLEPGFQPKKSLKKIQQYFIESSDRKTVGCKMKFKNIKFTFSAYLENLKKTSESRCMEDRDQREEGRAYRYLWEAEPKM